MSPATFITFVSIVSLTLMAASLKLCPPAKIIRYPFPAFKNGTPQAPYGCTQKPSFTEYDKNICFNEETTRLRMMGMGQIDGPLFPDAGVKVQKLIGNHEYAVETHNITTQDGYILQLVRIPYGKNPNKVGKGPVMLQHGVLGSATQWVLNTPDRRNLGFLLADNGYDVWLANSRGSTYSQGHVRYNYKLDSDYWEFSWHEIGKYDVPATIDHILLYHKPGTRVHYIGHSMGTTVLFTALSINPSYNDKIKMAFLLAPVGYVETATSIVHLLITFVYYIQPIAVLFLRGGPFPPTEIRELIPILSRPCYKNAYWCSICLHPLFAIFGLDYVQMNLAQFPVMVSHFPDQSSTKALLHFSQIMLTGEFREFDYGPFENPKRYNGSCYPPHYEFSNVRVPVVMFWGWNDNLATPKDVRRTAAALPNVIELVEIPHCAFSHLDFAIANDADKLVYNKILRYMDE